MEAAMRLDVTLQQRQQLQLKLAPQMIQAIEILQLPNIDLKDRIDLELAENEVLEVDEEAGGTPEAGTAQGADGSETATAEGGDSGDEATEVPGDGEPGPEPGSDAAFSETIERLTSMAEEDRDAGLWRSRGEAQEASDRKQEALQATAAPPPSLQELLAEQLTVLDAPEPVMAVARGLVYSLDGDGLLPVHPMARHVLSAMDAEGNLTRPLEEIVDALGSAPFQDGGHDGGHDGDRDGSPEGVPDGDAPADLQADPLPGDGGGGTSPSAAAPGAGGPAPGVQGYGTQANGTQGYGTQGYGTWGAWGPSRGGASRSNGPRDVVRAAAQREARRKGKEDAREERLREASRVAATASSLRRRLKTEGVETELEDAAMLFPLAEVLDLLEGEGLHATLDDASRAIDLVQSLEPHGIGGRTPEETLLLQLRPGDPRRDRKRHLITRHLDDWKKNRLPRICQAMGIPMEELKELLEDMSDLHPHPGALLRSERSQYVIPDVIIQWAEAENGDPSYEVRLVNEYFPSLRISPQYMRMFEDAATDPAVREMLKKKIGSARWLIDAIRQRQETLLRVVREIVQHQREFLEHGLTAMRPLKMQRIADDLGIHVSTVSRAIADKYAQTPQGILPLKFFFHGGTESTDGSVESRLSVKDRVRQTIEQEDRRSPLSDEDLAARFKAEGLNIARRTVTKYRKQLGIPSSRERREWE
jgi:RNA polymerase sigma-54 factor